MKMLDELRVASLAVVDHGMVVVTHRARQEHVDLTAQGGVDQAVEEGVDGGHIGAQQELTLAAAAGDQVALARKDLTGEHGSGGSNFLASRSSRHFGKLCFKVSGIRPARPNTGRRLR